MDDKSHPTYGQLEQIHGLISKLEHRAELLLRAPLNSPSSPTMPGQGIGSNIVANPSPIENELRDVINRLTTLTERF